MVVGRGDRSEKTGREERNLFPNHARWLGKLCGGSKLSLSCRRAGAVPISRDLACDESVSLCLSHELLVLLTTSSGSITHET